MKFSVPELEMHFQKFGPASTEFFGRLLRRAFLIRDRKRSALKVGTSFDIPNQTLAGNSQSSAKVECMATAS
jgi:hypothetical protein